MTFYSLVKSLKVDFVQCRPNHKRANRDEIRSKFDIGILDLLKYLTFPYLVWFRNGELIQVENELPALKYCKTEKGVLKALKSGAYQKELLQEEGKGKIEIKDQGLKFLYE